MPDPTDCTASAGVSVSGGPWHRRPDKVGLAGAINAISGDRRRYLAAGGLGILVGDGRLPRAGNEHILETYHEPAAASKLRVTIDYQWAQNPAYDRDRGPVSIVALRAHLEF